MAAGGYTEYIRKHPIAQMDAASSAVLTQWAKGAPNGLVSTEEKREETVFIHNYNVTPQLPANGLTVAELFCGGGLMAVGLQAAGYDITFANDFDKRAAEAYAYNIGDHVICGDITDEALQARIPDADIIAGGPPCQDYSVAGAGAGEEGERGKLVWTYLRIIADKRPKAFVFENVKGLITKKHRPTFDALLAEFDAIGYEVTWRLINAWDYGVAQKRERVFIVGVRKDLGFTFEFPEPSAEEYRARVLRDVIGDLPEPSELYYRHPRNYDRRAIYSIDEVSPTVRTVNRPLPEGYPGHPGDAKLNNHDGARPTREFGQRDRGVGRHPLSKMDDAAYTIIASTTGGKNAFYPDNHIGGVPTNIYPGHTGATIEGPAKAITAGGNSVGGGMNCLRPLDYPESKPRRFTVRECLRIQSVPDSYVLPDSISLSAQYRIVGNGVASRVSYVIGVALAEQLNAALAVDLPEAA